jgi:hypothetical protein
MTTMPRRRAAAAPAPVVDDVFEDVEDVEADDDIEELDDTPAPAPAPTTRRRSTKAAAPAAAKTTPAKAAKATPAPANESSEYDSAWLANHVSEETGVSYDGRAVRMLLRKLAKDGALAREVGVDRGRYTFPKGANDPTVRAIIKMIKSGEAKAVAQAGLDQAKAAGAAKKATATKAAPAKATKAAATPAKATTTRRRRAAATE